MSKKKLMGYYRDGQLHTGDNMEWALICLRKEHELTWFERIVNQVDVAR